MNNLIRNSTHCSWRQHLEIYLCKNVESIFVYQDFQNSIIHSSHINTVVFLLCSRHEMQLYRAACQENYEEDEISTGISKSLLSVETEALKDRKFVEAVRDKYL